jgi:hypothetical protein
VWGVWGWGEGEVLPVWKGAWLHWKQHISRAYAENAGGPYRVH